MPAKLEGANWSKCEAVGEDFSEAILRRFILDEAQLAGAIFSDCVALDLTIRRASARGARFQGGEITRGDFRRTILAEAAFHQAKLAECVFAEADLEDANFHGAALRFCDFEGARLERTRFQNAHLTRCNFAGQTLVECDFRGARLVNCDFRRAVLKNCRLGGAHLDALDLRKADLTQVRDLTPAQIARCLTDEGTKFPVQIKRN